MWAEPLRLRHRLSVSLSVSVSAFLGRRTCHGWSLSQSRGDSKPTTARHHRQQQRQPLVAAMRHSNIWVNVTTVEVANGKRLERQMQM